MEHARQPDCLRREVHALQLGARARRVALVENEIEHVHDGREADVALVTLGDRERHPRRSDGLLGAADSLRHRGLGDEKGAPDFERRQAADRAQREGDRRRGRERGVAAGEEHVERVVALAGALVGCERDLVLGGYEADDEGFAAPSRGLDPHVVGHLSRGDVDEPGAWAVWHPLPRPLLRSGEKSLLHRVFRGGEIAEPPAQGAQHLRREVAQQALDVRDGGRRRDAQRESFGGALITSRTSIAMLSGAPPGPGAADASAAIAKARSEPSTSTIQ